MTELEEVKRELAEVKAVLVKLVDGLHPPPREISLLDYLDEWLMICKKPFVSAKTFRDLSRNVHKHIAERLPNKWLYEITTDDLQGCLNAIQQTRTRESVHTLLLNAFARAHKLGYISANPCDEIIYRKHKRAGREPLTREQQAEFRELVAKCRKPFCWLFLFYLLTGVRKAEPLLLRWDDVREGENVIILRGTKTETSFERPLPIYPELKELLDTMRAERGRNTMLFPVSLTAIQKEVVKLQRKLSFRFSLHMLRHTFITNCVEKGVSLKAVQRWAGHKSLETTEKIYTHISSQFEQEEAKKIGGVAGEFGERKP